MPHFSFPMPSQTFFLQGKTKEFQHSAKPFFFHLGSLFGPSWDLICALLEPSWGLLGLS